MSDPFLAEIRIFPLNFAPLGWAFCNGQILPLSQNTALFSLLGTTYGGDGKTNFALPNLEGSVPMHPGQGPGLSLHDLGETGGSSSVTLLPGEMATHTHTPNCVSTTGNSNTAAGNLWAATVGAGRQTPPPDYSSVGPANLAMNSLSIQLAGGSLPHNNMSPYLTLNFCIALQGIYPQRP